jgi:hypothetical protein
MTRLMNVDNIKMDIKTRGWLLMSFFISIMNFRVQYVCNFPIIIAQKEFAAWCYLVMPLNTNIVTKLCNGKPRNNGKIP